MKPNHIDQLQHISRRLDDRLSREDLVACASIYLDMGEYDKALSDYALSGYLGLKHFVSDYGVKHVAAVLWLRGEAAEAADIWRYTVRQLAKNRFTHSDFAGGMQCSCLSWFAATSLSNVDVRDEAEHFMDKKLLSRRGESWPGPVAAYLLGRMSAQELCHAAASADGIKERQLCQAEFYIGVHQCAHGRLSEALTSFTSAADRLWPASIEMEYYLARHEANRLRLSGIAAK